MALKAQDRIYSSVKTLKTYGTHISNDSDDDDNQRKRSNNKDNTNTPFLIEDYLKNENCTSFNLGTLPMSQKCYICSICNPTEDKYICQYCFENCHKSCREFKQKKLESFHDKIYSEDNYYKGLKEFYCLCGNEYKHNPPNAIINEFGPCDLIKLDNALKLENFKCITHNIQICSVCSVQCHNKCKVEKTKKVDTANKKKRRPEKCLCKNECHTSYNEVAFTFPLNDYQKLSGVRIWPIQIMNILFNNKRTFHKLYTLFSSMLNSDDITEKEEKKFVSLLQLFSNTFNRKFKTFYYHEDILIMFKYESLINYMQTIRLDIRSNILLQFRLLFILLFVHLRRDFQMVKGLTSIDFLCSTALQRIEYKTILGKPNIYMENINQKYNNEKLLEEGHILKKIAFNDENEKNICRLMEISVKHLDIEKYANEYEIGLKYLCFILKKMMFTKEELIKLIKHLSIFFRNFYEYITSKNRNIYLLLNIFNGLAEIVFLIAVNYNDFIVMEYLNKYKKTIRIESIKPIEDFIHVKSRYGSDLYEIILKSCDILRRHYELIPKRKDENLNIFQLHRRQSIHINKDINIRLPQSGGLFAKKIVNLFTETLGIFSLADNIYYNQINSISKEDLVNYYFFTNRIQKDIWIDFNINEKNEIDQIINNLKNNIENRFNYLFTSSYAGESLELNKKIYTDIYLFSEQIKMIFKNYYIRNNVHNNNSNVPQKNDFLRRRNTLKSISDMEDILNAEISENANANNSNYNLKINTYSILNENRKIEEGNDNENEDEIKRDRNFKKYWQKLATKNNIYSFLKETFLNTVIEEFVDILIISNLDEVISKVLTFLSNRKFPNLLNYNLVDIIFSTMSLYFFNKRGMEYFLMGKNLTRINKIINRFNFNSNNKNNNPELGKNINDNIKIMGLTIDFLLDICKGIKVYGLNIKHHKILYRLKKNLLEHISMFNFVSTNNLVEFSIHFKKIMKIFTLLADDYPYEEFKYIKSRCILIFKQNPSNLLDKNIFFQIIHLLSNNSNKNIIIQNPHEKNDYNKKVFLSLYFTFLKLITTSTYYIYNNDEDNEILDILISFNNLPEIKNCFSNNIFNLKQKYIILRYLRTIYFIDNLDEYDILEQISPLSNYEFDTLIKNNLIQTNINSSDLNNQRYSGPIRPSINNLSKDTLINKYKQIKDIEKVIEIYLYEINQFPKQVDNCPLKYADLYYKELLFDIKYLADYFCCQKNNLWGELKMYFYRLSIEFLKNINSFVVVNKKIKNFNFKEKNIFFLEEEESNENNKNAPSEEISEEIWNQKFIEERINQMQSISFEVYNKKKIYCYITEIIDSLIKYCGLNRKYNLQNFLEYYDVMAESNFTPFSLLETLDYEYFYDEKMEEDNELIKQDQYLFKIKNLKNSFISTFIDINNTNFLEVITSTSGENFLLDFRKKYIDYFLSFLNSIEGNHVHKLEINLCILTKMMFYDSEGMQNKFTNIIKDQDFFPNLNIILNKYMVLVFSLSKNIYAYELAGKITNLNKLIIQFIQALGEGFNFTYHDNIFRLPVIDDKSIGTNKKIERFEEEKNNNYNVYTIDKNIGILNKEDPSLQIEALKKTIYESIINNLKFALYKLDFENMTNSELPYDKLIIFVSNAIDFLIEYIDSTDDNNDIIKMSLRQLLLGKKSKKMNERLVDERHIIKNRPYLDCFFSKVKPINDNSDLYLLRKKVICYTKIKLTQLLIYYSLTGGKETFIEKLVENEFSTINLYIEILYNFNELINHLKIKRKELIDELDLQTSVDSYSDKLINFYAYEEDFRNMIELQVVFQLFILIKIFEEIYKYNQLTVFFKKNKDNIENDIIDENGEINLRSKFSRAVYKFLQIIILKVEIKMDEEDEDIDLEFNDSENEDEDDYLYMMQTKKNKKLERIARKIKGQLKSDKTFASFINLHRKKKNTNLEHNIPYDNFRQFVINKNVNEEEKKNNDSSSEITEEDIDEDEEEEKSNIKTMFFPRPYLSFFLSKGTKDRFLNIVDRKSVSSKFNSLLNYADYCLYEMIVNKHLIGSSRFNNFCANIDYSLVEIVNYIFIVVQNILILWRFYKGTDLSYQEYYTFDQKKVRKLHPENMVIAIVQSCFLIVFLVIWYCFKFMNSCQYYIMHEYNKPFVGKRIGEDEKIPQVVVDYFQEKNVSTTTFFQEVNKGVSNWKKIYVYVFSTHILNREIIMLVLSLIFNICYIATRIPLFLVFQVLFLANIISTLFDIIYAIKLKWINIALLLLFDFLCVYVFMWFAFFFYPYFFVFEDVLIPESQARISEGFCFSSVQCYLFILTRGSLSNGGISNDLKRISYKNDVGLYLGRFFYDVLFFLLISLYIGKMFLSFIIDTFGELRNQNAEYTNDKENICFICQISRDECLMKNIDFEKHIKNVHNMWNYVYYLNYLYINNPFNFNWIENSVWEKLQEQGINWLPLKED